MRTLWFILLLAMVSAATSGCNDFGNAPVPITGIQGQVYSIATPGPTPEGWIPPPLEMVSTILVLDRNKKLIVEVITDSKGRFISPLDPGTYYVRVKESWVPAETGPYTLRDGEMLSVRANYDNGMR